MNQISTPADDPIFYDRDWRARTAEALVKAGRRRTKKDQTSDPGILLLCSCLKNPDLRKKEAPRYREVIGLASVPSWRGLLEAALLTEATYDEMAEMLGIEPDLIHLFENLYYNVRDDMGLPLRAQVVRAAVELENPDDEQESADNQTRFLKQLAIKGGWALLCSVLPSRLPDNTKLVTHLLDAELNRRLVQGELRNSDLIRLRSVRTAEERMLYETGQRGSEHDEGMQLVQKLLQAIAPKMVDALEHESAEGLEEAEAQLRGTMKERFADVTNSQSVRSEPAV